jgi:hypothetical protein
MMKKIAEELGLHSNPIKFLTAEIENLADRTMKFETA